MNDDAAINVALTMEPSGMNKALIGKARFDLIEQAPRQIMLFQQATKLENRRDVGHQLMPKVDINEIAYRTDALNRVFDAFIGRFQEFLGDVHPQHALKTNGWATEPVGLRVVRQQGSHQHRPRYPASLSDRKRSRRVNFYLRSGVAGGTTGAATDDQLVKHGLSAEQGHAATRNMIARN